jgi:hypothetical protein
VKGRSSLKPAVHAAGWPGTPPNSTADGPRARRRLSGMASQRANMGLGGPLPFAAFGRATTGQNGAKSGLATCNWKWAKTQ